MRRLILLMAVLGISLGGFLLTGSFAANAQSPYPQVLGSVVCGVTQQQPQSGSSVNVSGVVVNTNGSPVVGEVLTFQIASQPGNSASLASTSTVTSTGGVASTTLNVGTTPGLVNVTVSAGDLECGAAVDVRGPLVAEVLPSQFVPPQTGDGGLAGPATTREWLPAVALVVPLLALAALWRRRVA